MSDDLKQCLDAGNVLLLFPIMDGWSCARLEELQAEINLCYEDGCKAIMEHWGKLAVMPNNFFRPDRAAGLDAARDDAQMRLLGVCAEISSVIQYYLSE